MLGHHLKLSIQGKLMSKIKLSLTVAVLIFLFEYINDYFRYSKFGNFIFENSDDINVGIPFNYFLIDKNDNSIISFFVNDYIKINDYVYFSEINGNLLDDFCFYNNHLYLSSINLKNGELKRFIDTDNKKYEIIFHQLSKISNKDRVWLDGDANKCPS